MTFENELKKEVIKKSFHFLKLKFLKTLEFLLIFKFCKNLKKGSNFFTVSIFEKKNGYSKKNIKNFHCFQLVNFLLLLKHILLKKEHDLLVFELFVSKHFYEYFFLILMYVFVNLKS